MKVKTNDLKMAINACRKSMKKNNVMPVLSNICLQGTDTLSITAGSLEQQMSVRVEPEEAGEIDVLVDAEKLANTVNNSNSEHTELSQENNGLVLRSGKSKASFQCDPNEYPFLSFPEGEFTVNGDELRKAIESLPFVRNDDLRPNISGYNLKADDKLRVQGVDPQAAVLADLNIKGHGDITDIMLPVSCTDAIKTMLSGDVQVHPGDPIVLHKNTVSLSMRSLSSKFPDIDKIFPDGDLMEIRVTREDLERALEGAMGHKDTDYTKAIIEVKDNKMNISAETEVSSFETELECTTDGESRFAVNPQLALHAVKGITTNTIVMRKRPEEKGIILFYPEEGENVFLVCPMTT